MVSYLEDAVLFWADMGVDGIRHDATLHMDPSFVKGLKDAVDSHTTITHFGEFFIGRPDPKYDEYVYFPTQTGVNNLDFEYYRAASTTFGSFSTTMSDFANMLEYTQDDYGYPNQTVTFLDNHDVTRFGYTQRNEKVYNAALAVLLTSRGIPTIYYGTEQYIVPSDASDVAGRVYMPTACGFGTGTGAYQLISRLSTLRQNNDAIAYGTTTVRYSDDNVMIFERQFYDDVVVVAVNRQPDISYTVPAVQTSLPSGRYSDYCNGQLNGKAITVQGGTTSSFVIPGGGVCVWQYDSTSSEGVPHIGDIVSTSGRAGNTVYIYGSGFTDNSSVYFGTVKATKQNSTDTMIVATVPSGVKAGMQAVTVRNGASTSNSILYNVLSGDQNQIVFHINAQTTYGENIYIVGNVPELGNWDPDKCTEAMLNPNYPDWFLSVSVPAGTTIEFKFIKKDASGNITWESGDNRTITSSADSCGVVDTPVYTWRY